MDFNNLYLKILAIVRFMSQSIPSITIPQATPEQIFRNQSNSDPQPWENFWVKFTVPGKICLVKYPRAGQISNLYIPPTINNHLTLRFRKESYCFSCGHLKEVPLFAILTRNISSNFSPEFLSICEYKS